MDITDIFQELQTIGCIEYCRKLEASEVVKSFYANKKNNSIQYNSELNNLKDRNSIKFCLLHEEGHFRTPPELFIGCILSISLIVIIFFLLLHFMILDNISVFILIFLISIILILWYSWVDEYESDKFASLILRDVLKENTPSKILEKALKDISSDKTICNILVTLLMAIIHPPNQWRVKKISCYIDKKNT